MVYGIALVFGTSGTMKFVELIKKLPVLLTRNSSSSAFS